MSTTTAPIASAADEIRSSRAFAVHRIARLGGPLALVLGSVLAAVGMALHLAGMPEDVRLAIAIAEDPNWLASHVLLGSGFALVAVGAATALPLLRGRGAGLTAAGVVFTSLGALLMSLGDVAHGAIGFALAEHVDAATSFRIHEAFFEHPVFLGLNTAPLLLTVGMLLLGAGLLRSRAVPRWAGAALLLSPIGVHAAFILELPTYLHGVPFVVGMTVFAYALSSAPWSREGAE